MSHIDDPLWVDDPDIYSAIWMTLGGPMGTFAAESWCLGRELDVFFDILRGEGEKIVKPLEAFFVKIGGWGDK